jgi:hypothetical protein
MRGRNRTTRHRAICQHHYFLIKREQEGRFLLPRLQHFNDQSPIPGDFALMIPISSATVDIMHYVVTTYGVPGRYPSARR